MRRVRVQDWPSRLIAAVSRQESLPFDWQRNNCLTFQVDAVDVIVEGGAGNEFARCFTGYKTALGAARRLRHLGFQSMGDLLASHFEEIPPSMMQRGDLGVVIWDGQECGVVLVGDLVLGKAVDGNVRLSRDYVTRGFAV